MNKKALSPLMATILLVVFALVIGMVTMNLGKGYVEETEHETGEGDGRGSVVINVDDVLEDELKELQLRYINGQISREEYLEQEKEIVEDPSS